MLKTIIETGINDRWTANGASEFEADMAKLTGREATIFMISSIMGNQVAIRSHLGIPPYSLLCDTRSHLDPTEAGGVGIWSGVWTITVTPSNGLWLTLEDIQRHSVVFNEADSCTCPIKLIYLEVPLGGIVMPLPELRRICTWAHTHDIKIHMDGARLWEAVISGVGTLHEYCALPDSINLCLTKGLGGAVGSILVGDKEYLEQAQRVREAVGGSIRQPGFVAAAASAAVKYTWGKAIDGADSLLKPCHTRAAQLAGVWTNRGGRLACPQQTNMIWIDLDHAGIEEEEWEAEGRKRGLHLHSSRIIVHFRKQQR
ncbi:l-allo-threonine aldolase [Whalleya microplaca]|nr:l-allo-threonine aldolase [Whalleya microplaca]